MRRFILGDLVQMKKRTKTSPGIIISITRNINRTNEKLYVVYFINENITCKYYSSQINDLICLL